MKATLRTILAAALLLMAMTALPAMAQKKGAAQIRFTTDKIDLGTIKADGGPVTFVYPFVNEGDAPLVIVNVTNGGCGCTKPVFPKEPVAPGAKGQVSVTFNPQGRQGELNRTIRVKSNSRKDSGKKLHFTGVVVPAAK